MKRISIFISMAALLFLTGCNKNAKVKSFMTELAAAVSSNDKATIAKMYPDAVKADSLSLVFDAEKAQIEEIEGGGWNIALGEGRNLILVKNKSDGALSVKESHGIFSFTKSLMDFALKTGLVKKGMNDATIATQLSDTAFVSWVSAAFMKSFNKNFRISKVTDDCGNYASDLTGGGEWFITVKNDCDFDFAGSDYKVIVASTTPSKEVITLDGKDLFSGAEETLRTGYLKPEFSSRITDIMDFCDPNISLKINMSTAELLGKYYNPKGDEYENYLKTK